MQKFSIRGKTQVKLSILFHMAVRNLWFKRFRSFLTIVGVIIGMGAIFLLLSFGFGIQRLVESQVVGAETILTIDVASANSRILNLNPEYIERFQNLGHVAKVGKVFSFGGKVSLDGAEADTVVYGADANYLDLTNIKLVEGEVNNTASADELMINSSLLEAIGVKDFAEAIGKKVGIKVTIDKKEIERDFEIVGIIDSGSGSEVFVSDSIFLSAGESVFTQAKIEVDGEDQVSQLRQQIESLGFNTSSPIDTLEQINQIFRLFNFILAGFGSIGLIIAVLGMLNTLTVSLLERTQEIGLMVALGGRKQDMRLLFVLESLILSLLGGIIGIGLAMASGASIDILLNQMARQRGVEDSFTLFADSWELVLIIILFMFIMGLLVAYVPAKRAARINPIYALRHE